MTYKIGIEKTCMFSLRGIKSYISPMKFIYTKGVLVCDMKGVFHFSCNLTLMLSYFENGTHIVFLYFEFSYEHSWHAQITTLLFLLTWQTFLPLLNVILCTVLPNLVVVILRLVVLFVSMHHAYLSYILMTQKKRGKKDDTKKSFETLCPNMA